MTTTSHLRRARLRLTLTYALVMSVVLAIMAFLIVTVDFQLRESEASQELLEQAQKAASVIRVDAEGDLDLSTYESNDALRAGYPQIWVFAVLSRPDDLRLELIGGPYEDWLDAPVDEVAYGVVEDDASWMWDFTVGDDTETERVIIARGIPLGGPEGETAGVIVSAAEADDWLEPHNRLRTTVILIATGLVLVSAAAGYFLAGRALRPATDALAQQEQLIADAAHELRTPMARIRAAAEGGIAGDEEPQEALARVVRVSNDAGTFVDDLLVLARMDANQEMPAMEPLRLDLLVEAEAEGFDLSVETVETVVKGDPQLLRRAVNNLITNAVTHGSVNGGTDVTVTVYPNRVVVADRGSGLDPSVAEAPFDRFRSGPGSRGHGLGLAIVQWVARAHGGEARVAPRDGGGTVAEIILPKGASPSS